MTTDRAREASVRTKARKAAPKSVGSQNPSSKPRKGSDVTLTTNNPMAASSSSSTSSPMTSAPGAKGSGADDKGFADFLSGILPTVAQTVAPSLGIDPRVAGQTVGQVLNIFGIGGQGKAFTAAIPKDVAVSQIQQVVSPYLSDESFRTALQSWMQAALEPVQAQKQGKAYQPSVDLSKSWFDDIVNTVGDAVSHVNWGQVAQVGMQILPYALAAL